MLGILSYFQKSEINKMNDSGRNMEQYTEHHEGKLSIVVPTYNRAEDLKDLLISYGELIYKLMMQIG